MQPNEADARLRELASTLDLLLLWLLLLKQHGGAVENTSCTAQWINTTAIMPSLCRLHELQVVPIVGLPKLQTFQLYTQAKPQFTWAPWKRELCPNGLLSATYTLFQVLSAIPEASIYLMLTALLGVWVPFMVRTIKETTSIDFLDGFMIPIPPRSLLNPNANVPSTLQQFSSTQTDWKDQPLTGAKCTVPLSPHRGGCLLSLRLPNQILLLKCSWMSQRWCIPRFLCSGRKEFELTSVKENSGWASWNFHVYK